MKEAVKEALQDIVNQLDIVCKEALCPKNFLEKCNICSSSLFTNKVRVHTLIFINVGYVHM